MRVTFDQPNSRFAYGYQDRTYVFCEHYPIYDTPRGWLRMGNITTGLDSPKDVEGVVMEWAISKAHPLWSAGRRWGEEHLIGHPAILIFLPGADVSSPSTSIPFIAK
ncbi:MAG: hypothetical protein WB762_04455 [Candidatus Sulfotelmatobacter sp.]